MFVNTDNQPRKRTMNTIIKATTIAAVLLVGAPATSHATDGWDSTCYIPSTGENISEYEIYSPSEGTQPYGTESGGGTPCRPVGSDFEGVPLEYGTIEGLSPEGGCHQAGANGTAYLPAGEYEFYAPLPGEFPWGTTTVGMAICRPISVAQSAPAPTTTTVAPEPEPVAAPVAAPAPAPAPVAHVAPAVAEGTPVVRLVAAPLDVPQAV